MSIGYQEGINVQYSELVNFKDERRKINNKFN